MLTLEKPDTKDIVSRFPSQILPKGCSLWRFHLVPDYDEVWQLLFGQKQALEMTVRNLIHHILSKYLYKSRHRYHIMLEKHLEYCDTNEYCFLSFQVCTGFKTGPDFVHNSLKVWTIKTWRKQKSSKDLFIEHTYEENM